MVESQQLCVFLLEQAISKMPRDGEPDTILGIFDLKGFSHKNTDLGFIRFLVSFLV